ncbi:MAG: hypothetical protein JWN67_4978 [Actinomycetia bacterium]|nr:hypothetical protein [Actinomycetes bacterium]
MPSGRKVHPLGRLTLSPGDIYRSTFASEVEREFGHDGGWLLLSIEHSTWRAHRDLAVALVKGADHALGHVATHLAALVDLQVQAALFSVVEQFARLVSGIRSHRPGSSALFDAYTERLGGGGIVSLVHGMADLTVDELRGLLRTPGEVEQVRDWLAERDSTLSTDDAIAIASEGLASLEGVLSDIVANAAEVAALLERPEMVGLREVVASGHSLRNVDNAFRHGTTLLWPDCQPSERSFDAIGDEAPAPIADSSVHIFVSQNEPRYATVLSDAERTKNHLRILNVVSIRLRQLARALLWSVAADESESLIFLGHVDFDDPDDL